MISKQTIFHGFRGTTRGWGEKCQEHDEYSLSSGIDEYFGHGIYFFENDINEAYCWAKYNRNIKDKEICVIYAHIETDKVLDFFDRETYNDFLNIVTRLSELYENKPNAPKIEQPYDCKVINYICQKKEYKLVKGPYSNNHKRYVKLSQKGYTRIAKVHIQLCVRDKEIIKDKKIYLDEALINEINAE